MGLLKCAAGGSLARDSTIKLDRDLRDPRDPRAGPRVYSPALQCVFHRRS